MKQETKTYSQIEAFERDGVSYRCAQYYQIGGDGLDFVDGATLNRNLLLRQDAYRKVVGLLTSDEIKTIRKTYHLSQKDFGGILGLGQIDIVRYETKAVQTRSINDLLVRAKEDPVWFFQKFQTYASELTFDKIVEVRQAIIDYSKTKGILELSLKNSIDSSYLRFRGSPILQGGKEISLSSIASIIALASKRGISLYKTKLAKLLFFCDFESYKRRGISLTGIAYSHAPHGALPVDYDDLLKYPGISVQDSVVYLNGEECQSSLVSSKAKNTLSKEETDLVNRLLDRLSGLSSQAISEYMHEEKAYQKTKPGEIISYAWAKDLREIK